MRTRSRSLALLGPPVVAVVLALVLAAPRTAHAAAPELEVNGVEGCPSSMELRKAITTHLGHDDFDAPDAPRVAVRIRRQAEGLAADVTVAMPRGGPTSRTLDGGNGTCTELLRAAALTIALAIEAEAPRVAPPAPAQPPPPPPAPEPSSRPGADAAVVVPDAAEAARAPSDLRTDHAVIAVSAMTTLGLLPRASTGGSASARLRITDAAWLSARAFYLPETRMPNDAFGMTLVAGGLGACVEPFGSRSVAALGCAHVTGGSLAVVGANVGMRDSGAKPFGAALVSAGVRARVVGPLMVEGAVEAAVPFAHPTFVTDVCPPTGFQQSFAALALVLGAGVSIP